MRAFSPGCIKLGSRLLLLVLAPALSSCGAARSDPAAIVRAPFEQRTSRAASDEIPRYSRTPSALPADLAEEARSERFSSWRASIERDLVARRSRGASDRPLLITLLTDDGVLTLPQAEGAGRCLPAFSAPLAAADTVQTLLRSGPRVRYRVSTPAQFEQMLRDLETVDVEGFTIDPCPRCPLFSCFQSAEIQSAEDVVKVWAIGEATTLAMDGLYWSYALEAARKGRLETARDVSLDAVSYLALGDPRFHYLLGQTAIALGDPVLLAEARAFLRFLGLPHWEQRLTDADASGTPDFSPPEADPREPTGPLVRIPDAAGSPAGASSARGLTRCVPDPKGPTGSTWWNMPWLSPTSAVFAMAPKCRCGG